MVGAKSAGGNGGSGGGGDGDAWGYAYRNGGSGVKTVGMVDLEEELENMHHKH